MSHVRPPRGSAPRILVAFLPVLCALIALMFAGPGSLRADDQAWIERIGKALAVVETGVAELDGKLALPGTLVERIAALHVRLVPLEKAIALEPGAVSGKDDLSACTMDATNLNTRWKAVVKARADAKKPPKQPVDAQPMPPPDAVGPDGHPKAPPPPPPPPNAPVPGPKQAPPPDDKPPERKAGGKVWPSQIAFKATAKMSYFPTGHWVHVEVEPHVYVDKFEMTGYAGKISFTLRASGLLRDVKSVVVRVAVRMKGAITEASEEYRISEVKWVAEKVLGDDSIKSWINHDDFQLPVTPRWYGGGLLPTTIPLNAEAYVVSIVLPDGSSLTFDTPEYNRPKK